MRKRAVTGWLAAVIIISLCLTGCGDSKEAKEARLLGITQFKEGNYSEAVVSFDTALKEADGVVNKFELDILKYRGEAEYLLKDYAAAEHTYGILIDVDGGMPEYRYLRAAALALSGNIDGAIEEYTTAESADRTLDRNVTGASAAMSAIGKACTDAGDYDRAMSFYQRVEEIGGGTAQTFNEMGLSMHRADKYDEAIAYFDKGIALGDEAMTKELLLNKGAVYEQKGDFAKALEVFKAYASSYEATPEIEKEILFLESR